MLLNKDRDASPRVQKNIVWVTAIILGAGARCERLSGQPLCVPRPCGRRGHQPRRTRHSLVALLAKHSVEVLQ